MHCYKTGCFVDRKVGEHLKCYISSTKNQINCIVNRSTNEAEEKPLIKIHFKHTLAVKHAGSHYFWAGLSAVKVLFQIQL